MDRNIIKEFIREDVRNLLPELCALHGVAGFEKEVSDFLLEVVSPYVDEISVDKIGNVISTLNGSSKQNPTIMLAAHMDEIGLIVKHIDEDGFIFFDKIGGIRNQDLFSSEVIIKSKNKKFKGLLNCNKPGRPKAVEKIPDLDDFFIDVGANKRSEVVQMGIDIGDTIVIDKPFNFIGDNKITGKALDDRLLIFVIIEVLKIINHFNINTTTLFPVFTVQEEVGCRGAKASAFSLSPDIALAFDVTVSNDIPDVKSRNYISKIGEGVAIKVMDRIGGLFGLIASKEIKDDLIETAKKNNIKYQLEIFPSGSTDGATINLERGGIPTGVLDIPARYVHANEMVSLKDVIEVIYLIIMYLQNFN